MSQSSRQPQHSPAGVVHRDVRPLAGSTENASIAAGAAACLNAREFAEAPADRRCSIFYASGRGLTALWTTPAGRPEHSKRTALSGDFYTLTATPFTVTSPSSGITRHFLPSITRVSITFACSGETRNNYECAFIFHIHSS